MKIIGKCLRSKNRILSPSAQGMLIGVFPMIEAACEFGVKGIYVEKPFARSMEECDQIKKACETNRHKDGRCPSKPISPYPARCSSTHPRRGYRKSGRITRSWKRGSPGRRGGSLGLGYSYFGFDKRNRRRSAELLR